MNKFILALSVFMASSTAAEAKTYREMFGSEPNLSESLIEIGQDPSRVISVAQSDDIGDAYQVATGEARKLGVFGAPTFITRGEVFLGDDRLDDALAWHARRESEHGPGLQ